MKRLRSRDIINNRSLSPNRLPDAQSIMPIYIKKRSAPSQAIYKTPEKNYSYIRKNFDLKLPGLSNVEKETIDKIIDTSPNNLGKKMK